jgi:hypothetical protein
LFGVEVGAIRQANIWYRPVRNGGEMRIFVTFALVVGPVDATVTFPEAEVA